MSKSFKLTALALSLILTACNNNQADVGAKATSEPVAASAPSQTQETGVKVNELASIAKLGKELQPFVQTNPELWIGDKSDPFMGDIDAMNQFLSSKGAAYMSDVYDFGVKGLKLIATVNPEKKTKSYLIVTNDAAVKIDPKNISLLQGGDAKLDTIWSSFTGEFSIDGVHMLNNLPNNKNDLVTEVKGNGSRKVLVIVDPESTDNVALEKTIQGLNDVEINYIFVSEKQTTTGIDLIEAIWSQPQDKRLSAWREYVQTKKAPEKSSSGDAFNWKFSQNAVSKLVYKLPTIFNLSNFKMASDDLETNPQALGKWLDDKTRPSEVDTILKIKPLWTNALK